MNEKTFRKMYSKEEIKAIANDSVVTPKTGCRRMWTEEEIKAIAGGGGGGGGDATTVKTLLDAIQTCSALFKGYQGTSVDGLITYDDTSNVTIMTQMFQDCTNLTSIPLLNTSNVTNMINMFNGCTNLTTIPLINTSKVTNISNMFYGCSNLTNIPLLNTINVSLMDDMFHGCTNLTTIPLLNTSNVTQMGSMFFNCTSLITVPELDVSKVTFFGNMFYNCTNLKSILMTGMKESFDISASKKFERTDLVTILNNLGTVTSTKRLTMGATNIGKLTDEDKAIATNKGWTLA